MPASETSVEKVETPEPETAKHPEKLSLTVKAKTGKIEQLTASLPSNDESNTKAPENKLAQTESASQVDSDDNASFEKGRASSGGRTTLAKVKEASGKMIEMVTSLNMKDASNPVKEAHALFLFVFSFATIVMCCASTTICVRAARDSNIAMNALSIRRKY
mmetsp:Transcript_16050/g.20329  ORF Transcript_16050/g.20329 Transcript_16050/m.20329 type:complete len:161 (+) Transcript_16050:307-789(+)|eukprot:CAMPEP_0170465220 /NCGR_PEP_ID=MMETSP0123-20130129/9644_1 /TAXON_ID=182087 /ORGANISM="Favella ehrenbergii, Strain Fehren 1" /LENGTH=160 /DNA_ID=CAMNT_0010731059 /DNA_START=307 /DNA_END=789 /DNA_ORIENTATION=+